MPTEAQAAANIVDEALCFFVAPFLPVPQKRGLMLGAAQ